MKRTGIALIGAFLLTIGMSSCGKAYNCHCVYKTDGTVTHEDDTKINEGKKEKSEASCNDMDHVTTTTLNGTTSTSTTDCTLQD